MTTSGGGTEVSDTILEFSSGVATVSAMLLGSKRLACLARYASTRSEGASETDGKLKSSRPGEV